MPPRTARHSRWLPTILLLLAPLPFQANAEPPQERVLQARPGDTIAALLANAHVEPDQARPALAALAPLFPPHRLRPGQEVTLRFAPGPRRLREMAVEPEPGRTITVTHGAAGWTAEEETAQQQRHLVLAAGQVRGAMIDAMQQAGVPAPMALDLIRTLSWRVDFQREVQPGDRFRVVFERFRDPDGKLLRDGQSLYASFELSGRAVTFWRYESAGGEEWYDEAGESMRRPFLSTPLDGGRVTSGFGMRVHPVLGYSRVHQGIDFAAPIGTPVYAAADGEVLRISRIGGYGRMVALRHPGGAETHYAHLSAFAPGLRPGLAVRQGQVIGRVGRTGLTTGPHLHYEVRLDGALVNPASARMVAGPVLAGEELNRFHAAQRALQSSVASLAPMEEVAAAE